MDPWKDIADSVLATIKDRASDFLDANKPAKDFIEDRVQTLAKYTFEYVKESDEPTRKAIMTEMVIVKQTIENELSALALNGQTASIQAFKDVVGTALGALIKYAPVLLAAI